MFCLETGVLKRIQSVAYLKLIPKTSCNLSHSCFDSCVVCFKDYEKGGTVTVADFIGAARKGK